MHARRHGRPVSLYALAVVLVIAGGYLCFELGRYEAGYSLIDHRRAVADYEARLAKRQADEDELRRQLAILKTSGSIDRETYSKVEANLADLQARIQSQEEELAFYRGIVSPKDGAAGLRVESLEIAPADSERRYTMRLVLVQAIGHSRQVAGTVKLQIDGTRDGQMASLDLADLIAPSASFDSAYQFRYFQTLETEFVLPVGFEPDRIQVELTQSEPHGDKLTESYEWSDVIGD